MIQNRRKCEGKNIWRKFWTYDLSLQWQNTEKLKHYDSFWPFIVQDLAALLHMKKITVMFLLNRHLKCISVINGRYRKASYKHVEWLPPVPWLRQLIASILLSRPHFLHAQPTKSATIVLHFEFQVWFAESGNTASLIFKILAHTGSETAT